MDSHGDWEMIRAARERCRNAGREVLTPRAAAALFGLSEATVRVARLSGAVETALTLAVTGKPIQLLLLDSALRYWRRPGQREFLRRTLEEFRANGTTISVGTLFYNVLHSEKSVIT